MVRMGLFANRPEEQTEWAGLPSEPRDHDDRTRLPDAPEADVLGLDPARLDSVSITVPLPDAAPDPEGPDDSGAE